MCVSLRWKSWAGGGGGVMGVEGFTGWKTVDCCVWGSAFSGLRSSGLRVSLNPKP